MVPKLRSPADSTAENIFIWWPTGHQITMRWPPDRLRFRGDQASRSTQPGHPSAWRVVAWPPDKKYFLQWYQRGSVRNGLRVPSIFNKADHK